MADHHSNLITAMDNLWFHQNTLLSQPIFLLSPQTKKLTRPISEIPTTPLPLPPPPPQFRSPPFTEESGLSNASTFYRKYVDDDDDDDYRRGYMTKRPTRLDLVSEPRFRSQPLETKLRSYSSSPSIDKHPPLRNSGRRRSLSKTKSSSELEYRELKGFMDLGFIFNKEELSPHMMNIIPGLHRLAEESNVDEDEKNKMISRPYLSEAWLINRPDSPLLNLKIPPIADAAPSHMKKHLRFWARTVASVIHQES
eukprot:TRINITY_DN1173_c1_g1_i1.p1 TRINITY_DN1173_c1_g1~~TRINITY_DN1173_c1_g1_i1.p1  ORF type:complete len:284 (-),score=33.28 TRINITY_DN1173_c1_g1_i1:230-988(-)